MTVSSTRSSTRPATVLPSSGGAPFAPAATPPDATTWLRAQFGVLHDPAAVAADLAPAGDPNGSSYVRLSRFRPRFGPRQEGGTELHEDLGRLNRTVRWLFTDLAGIDRFRTEQAAILPDLLTDLDTFIAEAGMGNPWIAADVASLASWADRLAATAQANYERPIQEWDSFLRLRAEFNKTLERVALYLQVAAEGGTPYQICNGLLVVGGTP